MLVNNISIQSDPYRVHCDFYMAQQAHLDPAALAVELLSGGNWKLPPELSGFGEEDD